MTLWRRILIEKRMLIIPLAFGIAANIGIYAAVVYPRGVKSANAAGRASAAVDGLRAAERDFESAKALVAGKSRAEQEISTFYDEVLPADLIAAGPAGAGTAIEREVSAKPVRSGKSGEGCAARPSPHPRRAGRRLQQLPAVHLRIRKLARIRHPRRLHDHPERSGEAAHAQPRTVDLLPSG